MIPIREWAHGQVGDLVWGYAAAAARQLARGIVADDLRYACHKVALGQVVSSKRLTNSQLDRVLAVFRHMADPDDIAAVMDMQNPDLAARRRLEWAVNGFGLGDAYVQKVCSAKFGTVNWKALDTRQLSDLVKTLSQRSRAKADRGSVSKDGQAATSPF